MNIAGKHISTALSILVLFALLMGIVYLFQPVSNPPLAARTTEIPVSGYPPPNTPIDPTQLATLMAYVTQEVLTLDDLTPLWFTPEPTLTSTPSLEGTVVTDPLNKFSIELPEGWFAYVPDANATGGATTITNYDLQTTDKRPFNGVIIHISSAKLNNGQNFDNWVDEWRKLSTSPASGAVGIELTDVTPYSLGVYSGVAYTYTSVDNFSPDIFTIIFAPYNNLRVIVITVGPSHSPFFTQALDILTTISL